MHKVKIDLRFAICYTEIGEKMTIFDLTYEQTEYLRAEILKNVQIEGELNPGKPELFCNLPGHKKVVFRIMKYSGNQIINYINQSI